MTKTSIELLTGGVLLFQKHWQSDQDGDPVFGGGDLMRSSIYICKPNPMTAEITPWICALSQHVPLEDIEELSSGDWFDYGRTRGFRFGLRSTSESVHDRFWIHEMQDTAYGEFEGLAEFMAEHGHAWTAAKILGSGHQRETALRKAACEAADFLTEMGEELGAEGGWSERAAGVRDALRTAHGACLTAASDDTI